MGASPPGRPVSAAGPDAGRVRAPDRDARVCRSAPTGGARRRDCSSRRGFDTGRFVRSSWPAGVPCGRERRPRLRRWPARWAHRSSPRLTARACSTNGTRARWAMPDRPAAGTHLPHADVMLAVGCRFTEVMTDWRRMPVPPTLIQIDLDADQIGMNYPAAVGIVADARPRSMRWSSAIPAMRPTRRLGRALARSSCGPHPRPEWLIDTLREALPRRHPGVHRRLRDGLSHAGGLAVVRTAAVLLSVQLYHAGLGVPGRGRRGRGAAARRWSRSVATAGL